MFEKRVEGACTAKDAFAALREQVVERAASMHQQGPDQFLPSDESLDPYTRKFEIARKTWDGTLHTLVRFELGGRHITVKEVGVDGSTRIAFQIFPGWDEKARACRLAVHGTDWPFDAPADPDLEVISELALNRLRRDA